jgi:precorrin-3B synthase
MPTGDGLLVRLMPTGTIALDDFAKLCNAARNHGNGIIEVTARGSIQVRGLDAASAPRFAAEIGSLGIAAADGVAVVSDPLAGLDGVIDAAALAAGLRGALAERSLAGELGAKISVAIDGGGPIDLDGLAADVRLNAEAVNGDAVLRIGIGGDAMSATQLGSIAAADGIDAVMRLLDVIARHGRDARARDILTTEGLAPFRAALASGLAFSPASASSVRRRRNGDAIGLHRLRDGAMACGIGLAFGHADATSLQRLTECAREVGAGGLRTAPGRAILTIGLAPASAAAFGAAAERLGFITRADDPRRRVVACAGAPICRSGYIAARALAPDIAAAAAACFDGAGIIHISGCAKGCAHPRPAALTVVGTSDGCALIAHGTCRDEPFAVVAVDQLAAAIATLTPSTKREDAHV